VQGGRQRFATIIESNRKPGVWHLNAAAAVDDACWQWEQEVVERTVSPGEVSRLGATAIRPDSRAEFSPGRSKALSTERLQHWRAVPCAEITAIANAEPQMIGLPDA